MVDFELKRVGLPPEKIIPKSSTRVEIEEAISQSESIVDQLTEDVSGIGPKAAIRYLLRYE